MRLLVADEAHREFETAERYYNRQVPGLGGRFRDEVRNALQRILAWPFAAATERADIRRVTLARFPYKVLYSVELDYIYIIAIAHQHRKPDYWSGRTRFP